ncbi:MAG TPA: hypothetical protein VK324_01735 [Tepidisphaeraceae bacterium]|nr:hypothetical protein [Tepidisphaeraceae bacterium]
MPATVALLPAWSHAQDAAAPAAPERKYDRDLRDSVDEFWHYGKIARYDLANAAGQKVIAASPDPVAALQAFEDVAKERKDDLDQWMIRWQGVGPLKETATQLAALLGQARGNRRADTDFIEQNINRLDQGDRAFILASERLKESGELAVPQMVSALRDANRKNLHEPIRQALRRMGRVTLNPLVAATAMRDADTLIALLDVLADIGYDAPVPYLARLAQSDDASQSVRAAAAGALARMGAGQNVSAPDAFYDLAERFYYDKSAINVDPKAPAAYVWYWDDAKGLTKRNVPPAIFNEVMAKRAAEYALKTGDPKLDAVSLWLAANYKREAQLPEGQTDATLGENAPPASYYGVQEGTRYLYAVLARALNDQDNAVALKAIKSLQAIVGRSTMSGNSKPLTDALRYGDRQVRFEAAFAVASALPTQAFDGSDRIVPLLAEAMSQTGQPAVVVVAPTQDQVNKLVDAAKEAGYRAVGGTTAQQAVANAGTLPAVDAIVLTEELPASEIDRTIAIANQNPRLERTARLIITATPASPLASRATSDRLVSVTQATDAAGLKPALDEARRKAGALPLDEKAATDYALRAADLLQKLAILNVSGNPSVFDLRVAETALLAALNDARPEVVKAASGVLALVPTRQAQPALLARANDEKAADDVKVALFRDLATNAKFFGNTLGSADLAALQASVNDAQNVEVRTAAAEARGALNLPPEQAKELILQQAEPKAPPAAAAAS